jgi:hypothetical protein
MLAAIARLDIQGPYWERSDMIPTLEAAVFFLAITAVLGFSTWAEGWLAPNSRSATARAPGSASSAVRDLSERSIDHETVRAA